MVNKIAPFEEPQAFYVIIIIFIKSCSQHRFVWLSLCLCLCLSLSLFAPPYYQSLPVDLPNYILCLHVDTVLVIGQKRHLHYWGP